MAPIALHVLIVDDREDDAELIARALRRNGFTPVCHRAESAEALQASLHAGIAWDVVLCDSVMPRLDVLRTLSLVRGANPDVPVLVVSGRHESELREVLASGEVSGALSKDRLADLPALVRVLLRTRSGFSGRDSDRRSPN